MTSGSETCICVPVLRKVDDGIRPFDEGFQGVEKRATVGVEWSSRESRHLG